MIEEQYRELAEHARDKFIELENKYNKEKLKYHELKKEFLSAYGMKLQKNKYQTWIQKFK